MKHIMTFKRTAQHLPTVDEGKKFNDEDSYIHHEVLRCIESF